MPDLADRSSVAGHVILTPEVESELPCVLIPVASSHAGAAGAVSNLPLLLPNEAVVEIQRNVVVTALPGMPVWHVGSASWRGRSIPVVEIQRFDAGADTPLDMLANDGDASFVAKTLCVLNRSTDAGVEFYAVIAQGTPRLMRLEPADLVTGNSTADAAGVAVLVGQEEALIPALAQVERALAALQPH